MPLSAGATRPLAALGTKMTLVRVMVATASSDRDSSWRGSENRNLAAVCASAAVGAMHANTDSDSNVPPRIMSRWIASPEDDDGSRYAADGTEM
ncbi:hypothetical protein PIB19_12875 [Sphingomonas sp. 7/4-4]|uniref:hypothetical protein n=1 Tax=Sphingomonas sp. 7/4-4 TaxID=3018446 RepID=UPI0022F3A138|nr:hypothetical protein [Sphingomonas sp. 7/4-4]WBY06488.1 hypothetical protein PIB19_12875 [Sphingomonas sp. 7/4-4]